MLKSDGHPSFQAIQFIKYTTSFLVVVFSVKFFVIDISALHISFQELFRLLRASSGEGNFVFDNVFDSGLDSNRVFNVSRRFVLVKKINCTLFEEGKNM